jgi:hypothetical protein
MLDSKPPAIYCGNWGLRKYSTACFWHAAKLT